MVLTFRTDNTEGYTQKQLDALNQEWLKRMALLDISENSPNYYDEKKRFADEVARR